MMPTTEASAIECQKTNLKILPSLPNWVVAELAMMMDCASTILPITPPALLAAHMRMGASLSCCAVIRCKLPNNAFEEVSLPGKATPNEPRNVPKKGKNHPQRGSASP